MYEYGCVPVGLYGRGGGRATKPWHPQTKAAPSAVNLSIFCFLTPSDNITKTGFRESLGVGR